MRNTRPGGTSVSGFIHYSNDGNWSFSSNQRLDVPITGDTTEWDQDIESYDCADARASFLDVENQQTLDFIDVEVQLIPYDDKDDELD